MNENKLIETIYLRLDGKLNREEEAELDRYLAEHPEAARIERQCRTMHEQLMAEPVEGTVPDLKPDILKNINQAKYAKENEGVQVRVVRLFWHHPAVRFGLTFAAGIVAGVFLFSVWNADFKSSSSDNDLMKGTFSDTGTSEMWTNTDLLSVKGQDIKATCRTRYSGQMVELYLDLSSQDAIDTTIEFSAADFDPLIVVNQQVNSETTTATGADFVRIHSTGDNKLGIKLNNKNSLPHEMVFKISRRNNQEYENTIEINKK